MKLYNYIFILILIYEVISKVNKRYLIVPNGDEARYLLSSFRSEFDEIIFLDDYIQKVSDIESTIDSYGRLPSKVYNESVTSDSNKALVTKPINKVQYVKLKDIDFGENNAYFVVGKLGWYYIRDFHSCHVGLRNTKLDWQIPHLEPFSMGSNKFVFCHNTTDEFYEKHKEYFFNDDLLTRTIPKVGKSKILNTKESIVKALDWATGRDSGTRFGLDYETNGLWRNDRYEDFLVIGFGIATKNVAYYVELRFLSDQDLEEVKSAYKKFLDKHESSIWVFNVDFELMATRKFLGEWAVYEFKDADVWRIIYGNQVGYSKKEVEVKKYGSTYKTLEKVTRDQRWSLKYTAQKYLNVPSWDNEFEEVEEKLSIIFNGYKHESVEGFLTDPLISKYFHKWVSEKSLTTAKVTSLIKKLTKHKHINSWTDLMEIIPEDLHEDIKVEEWEPVFFGCKTFDEVVEHPVWKDLMSQYPEHEGDFIDLVKDKRFFGNQYATQPCEIVGKYCLLDCYYTVMIAEVMFEKDDFKYDPENPVSAEWITTQKMVDIFARNKSLGALLNLYGLQKSNVVRDNYNDIQEKVRIFMNYILACGYYNILLSNTDTKVPGIIKNLHPVFKSCAKNNVSYDDFNRVTKTLFKDIYDSNEEFGWSDKLAKNVFGEELANELKSILISHKPNGFIDEKVYNRSINLHKECGQAIKEVFEDEEFSDEFDWDFVYKYFNEKAKVQESIDKVECLKTFNIRGKTLEEVLKMNEFKYICLGEELTLSRSEMLNTLKKEFFDVATATEVELGQRFEKWKDFRIFFTMYSSSGFKSIIDEAEILKGSKSVEESVKLFNDYIIKVATEYDQPKLFKWEDALQYAIDNNLDNLTDVNEKELESEPLQVQGYIEQVISADLFKQYKITKDVLDKYMWYNSINPKMMKEEKEWMLKYKSASPLSYNDKLLDKGLMCKTYDEVIQSTGINYSNTADKLKVCTISDEVDYSYYPIMATAFKIYRKYDKLGQYLTGQLVDNDYEVLSVDSDGVPKLKGLTKEEKHSSKSGENVRMYPRYEIMQKLTKRNSSGIHTVPGSSEAKGVIIAPEDEFLVYTDISSMELRGIAAVAKDEVMIDYFNSGKDIKVLCPYIGIYRKQIA